MSIEKKLSFAEQVELAGARGILRSTHSTAHQVAKIETTNKTGAHTPGPWRANGTQVTARVGESERPICDMNTSAPSRGERYDIKLHGAEYLANLMLLAAAPRMLEALRRAALALAFASQTSDAMRDDYEAVSSAIAAATGGTP